MASILSFLNVFNGVKNVLVARRRFGRLVLAAREFAFLLQFADRIGVRLEILFAFLRPLLQTVGGLVVVMIWNQVNFVRRASWIQEVLAHFAIDAQQDHIPL